jgi:hypothetical protein
VKRIGRKTESSEVLDGAGYAFRSVQVAININKIPSVRIAHGAPSRQAVVGRITTRQRCYDATDALPVYGFMEVSCRGVAISNSR